MMGVQAGLFCEVWRDDHVPGGHLPGSLDRGPDPGSIRGHLADFHSHTGRPSGDPGLLIHCPAGHCAAMAREGGCLWLGR